MAHLLPMRGRPPRTPAKSSNRIRVLRERAGLTQDQLAERVGGMSGATIGHLETGRRQLKERQIEIIAKALDVPARALLPGDDDTPDETTDAAPFDRALLADAVRQIHPFLDRAVLADPDELSQAILDIYDQMVERARAQARIDRRPIRVTLGGNILELRRRRVA
jgi:transcriptional regulator with XRE-family HTH domain